jgi:hypothetical protein
MLTNGCGFLRAPRTRVAILVALSALFAFTACARRSAVQKPAAAPAAAPAPKPLPAPPAATAPAAAPANVQYENVVFRPFTAAPAVQNPDAAMQDCMRSAMDQLQRKNVFRLVEMQGTASYTEPTLFVDLQLTDLRLVSGATRFWTGALSGRSYMKIMAKLTDAGGAVVAEQELFGAPNALGSAYSFGGSDRELPSNMGKLVSEFVLANAGRK